jgi:hypothetical protein
MTNDISLNVLFVGKKWEKIDACGKLLKTCLLEQLIWSRLSMRPFRDIAATVSTTQP